jgi:hypothetical protein
MMSLQTFDHVDSIVGYFAHVDDIPGYFMQHTEVNVPGCAVEVGFFIGILDGYQQLVKVISM